VTFDLKNSLVRTHTGSKSALKGQHWALSRIAAKHLDQFLDLSLGSLFPRDSFLRIPSLDT
jgi:hypothetical protein